MKITVWPKMEIHTDKIILSATHMLNRNFAFKNKSLTATKQLCLVVNRLGT